MSTESAGTLDIAEIEAKRAVLVARKDARLFLGHMVGPALC
jgi:hypothetical protein